MSRAENIMIALDVDDIKQAERVAAQLAESGITLKAGNQLGTFAGWHRVAALARKQGCRLFCDTKFKDIPATVEQSARAITRHKPDFFTVMADNSPAALEAAVSGVDGAVQAFGFTKRPHILGVTVLTSMSEQESAAVYGGTLEEKVIQFADAAARAGLDGLVCSAAEAGLLRQNPLTKHMLLVTPGIRPAWAVSGDQSRVLTPRQAMDAGANYLVIGRPITQPPAEIGTPRDALQKVIEEMG